MSGRSFNSSTQSAFVQLFSGLNLFRSRPSFMLLVSLRGAFPVAFQVLEAWCSRATAFAQCGLALHSGFPVSSAKRDHNGDGVDVTQTLSEVMGVAMKALVHPAKLISSLAPALLEHVVNLRHVSKTEYGIYHMCVNER